MRQEILHITRVQWGSGSGGRVVTNNTRGPGFKSSHRQFFKEILFTVNCCSKDKNNPKEAGMAHFYNF